MKGIIERVFVYILYMLSMSIIIYSTVHFTQNPELYETSTVFIMVVLSIFMITFTIVYCWYTYQMRKAVRKSINTINGYHPGKRNMNSLDDFNSSYWNITEEESLTLKQDIKKQYELNGHHNN